MPELPEVEYAARRAREAASGRRIIAIRTLHPSHRRALPDSQAGSCVDDVVQDVRRRGKHQLIELASGRRLHVHFRMTGDWQVLSPADALSSYARVVLELSGDVRLVLDDPRALATISLHEAGSDPIPALGPDATEPAFDVDWLRQALQSRRIAVKLALLDQTVVAGVGNIYAAEALWYARIDPRLRADSLVQPQLAALVSGVRRALGKALRHPERYYAVGGVSDAVRFNVYDRAGKPCRRCRTAIARVTQGGRSTYFCPRCQR